MSNVRSKIKTNNHWKVFLSLSDLPPVVVRKNFAWMSPAPSSGYIKYDGNYYHVSEFKGIPARMIGGDWQYGLQLADGRYLLIVRSECGSRYQIGLWRGF